MLLFFIAQGWNNVAQDEEASVDIDTLTERLTSRAGFFWSLWTGQINQMEFCSLIQIAKQNKQLLQLHTEVVFFFLKKKKVTKR